MTLEPSDHLFSESAIYLAPADKPLEQADSLWEFASLTHSTKVSLDFLKKNAIYFTQNNRVVILDEAKPVLKTLLKHGIDVARPVCLKTLESLTQTPKTNTNPFERLTALLEAVDSMECKPLARLECLALRSFAAMEYNGLYIDLPKWTKALEKKQTLAAHTQQICEKFLAPLTDKDLFGTPIVDLNQLEHIRPLFENVVGQKLDALTIENLRRIDHPLAQAYIEYKESSKLVATYGERFLEYVDKATSRIHADFQSLGTSTGRVSCQKPNLQNLPSDPLFKDCLSAPKGRALIHADFSACELRILAGLAQDANFLSTINSDEDFHSAVASRIFKEKVSKTKNTHLRERAKAISFGIIYGMGQNGLARSLGISGSEAQEILDRYFASFSMVENFLKNCVSSASRLGYARTYLGRRLYFPNAQDGVQDISRIAKNMPIQGTAAELAKLAMMRVHERLSSDFSDAFLVNMIHDELVIECNDSQKHDVARVVKEEMLGAQEALFSNVRPEVEVSIS